jgi:type II restriction/modification system DNA methylase subunit YeeA
MVGPEAVLGLELHPSAAELARVTVWIGEIQWMLSHGFALSKNPILKPLKTIEQRDAIINQDGTEPEWPTADVIVGNPPFLGDKKMLGALGDGYVNGLRKLYQGRVPGGADLVTYWFEKARSEVSAGRVRYAGLVATNSIRGGANRKVLDRIAETGAIFSAWPDEPWINEGAEVRVSMISFGVKEHGRGLRSEGIDVVAIFSDLSTSQCDHERVDITRAMVLQETRGTCFQGSKKVGAFDIPGSLAREWLMKPNPDGRKNSDVLFPYRNGLDITRVSRDVWIIDFGLRGTVEDAALYELPFAYVLRDVKPSRDVNNRETRKKNWWRHGDGQPAMRLGIRQLRRFIVTPEVSKHRVFVWLERPILPDCKLMVIAREDDLTFGVLHSRFHEVWALHKGSWHGVGNDPRYIPSTTFETFPFPAGMTPVDTIGSTETLDSGAIVPAVPPERRPAALGVAEAAARINTLREGWLNPSAWVERVPEVVPGYPDRIIPKPEYAAEIKKLTLTSLYNARPAWLDHAHQALDAAVAAAYGWTDYRPDMPESEILRRLLALNLERAN